MDLVIGACIDTFKKQHKDHLNEKCSWEVDFLVRHIIREKILIIDHDLAVNLILKFPFPEPFKLEKKKDEVWLVWDPIPEKPRITITSKIYFILSDDGYVKIGLSNEPEKRLKSLQTATAHQLEIIYLMPGTLEVEQYLHTLFSEDHSRGEWFIFSDKIREFIRLGFCADMGIISIPPGGRELDRFMEKFE